MDVQQLIRPTPYWLRLFSNVLTSQVMLQWPALYTCHLGHMSKSLGWIPRSRTAGQGCGHFKLWSSASLPSCKVTLIYIPSSIAAGCLCPLCQATETFFLCLCMEDASSSHSHAHMRGPSAVQAYVPPKPLPSPWCRLLTQTLWCQEQGLQHLSMISWCFPLGRIK